MSLAAYDAGFCAAGRSLLHAVSLEVSPGVVHAILGPNGAGKSTLLKLLSGEWQPSHGRVEMDQRDLRGVPLSIQARQRAVMSQASDLQFSFNAEEVVALGRLPCARHAPLREAGIIDEAMKIAGCSDLVGRSWLTLSGGERARVQFARAIVQIFEPNQENRYLLLDEPTASLDLAHQHACLAAARTLAETGVGVLVIVHDPNLAMRYADEATLLKRGRLVAQGLPASVLNRDNLEQLYDVRIEILHSDTSSRPFITVSP